jgi:hypothetical protein
MYVVGRDPSAGAPIIKTTGLQILQGQQLNKGLLKSNLFIASNLRYLENVEAHQGMEAFRLFLFHSLADAFCTFF